MGTRAQFFIGNPEDIEGREWLGTVGWDGYPDGDIGDALDGISSEAYFRNAVRLIGERRDDFCDPVSNDFPFPWHNDLFLTDCTYALFDGKLWFTYYHSGWVKLSEYRNGDEDYQEAYSDQDDKLPSDVPAPTLTGKNLGPDSIIIVTT